MAWGKHCWLRFRSILHRRQSRPSGAPDPNLAAKPHYKSAAQTLRRSRWHRYRWWRHGRDRVAVLIDGGLREHTAEFGFPRMRWLAVDFTLPPLGLGSHHRHSGAVELDIEHGNRGPRGMGRSNCRARFIACCWQAPISAPIASAVRSTALVVTSNPASSFICSRPWSKGASCRLWPASGARPATSSCFLIQVDIGRGTGRDGSADTGSRDARPPRLPRPVRMVFARNPR